MPLRVPLKPTDIEVMSRLYPGRRSGRGGTRTLKPLVLNQGGLPISVTRPFVYDEGGRGWTRTSTCQPGQRGYGPLRYPVPSLARAHVGPPGSGLAKQQAIDETAHGKT